MFCPNCGSQMMDGTIFCTNCGSPMTPRSMIVRGNRVITALQDPLFLVICILWSISTLVQLTNGFFNVIPVLLTIFLWLVFAKARRGETPQNQLRCISGVVYAQYIIVYVLAGVMLLAGILCLVFATAFPGRGGMLLPDLGEFALKYLPEQFWDTFDVLGVAFFVGFGIGLILAAAAYVVINILSYRRIHRFAKSVYENAYSDVPLLDARVARIWLMIFGIISAAQIPNSLLVMVISGVEYGSASTGFVSLLASGCSAAVSILASILIKKHYSGRSA